MHLQEVFRAIYANHTYEYLVISQAYRVMEYSDKVFNYCEQGVSKCEDVSIFELFPELHGMQELFQELLEGKSDPIVLPYVFKEPDAYITIRIHLGRREESLIVLVEDITTLARMEQRSVQERNDKSLLLEELADKNLQLQAYNERMQELVAEETRKNLEKQKMLETQSRHSQMGEMIGMITHQWKQPLGVISMSCAYLQMMQQRDKLNETLLAKQLEDITKQVKHMNTTVNDFQEFFNPSREKFYFNVKKTITTILDLIRNEYEHNKITLELTGDDFVTAYGFPNEYNQVIISILKNAKDVFFEAPHEAMAISIDVGSEGDRSLVRIRDNAGGIEESIIETVFDLYMTTKDEGSGLGLNIAKNVIEVNMDGVLKVCNVSGGAEFSILV
ncbi:MAG: HAMP domain-containing sensor histidine kinase [Campylobacterota bacterium]|nr:HAMP domain-containing sensor histidine kinase [Campylobacterota bacterium]